MLSDETLNTVRKSLIREREDLRYRIGERVKTFRAGMSAAPIAEMCTRLERVDHAFREVDDERFARREEERAQTETTPAERCAG